MANTAAATPAATPTLPKLDEIESIAADDLPALGSARELSDDERKLAEAIIAATNDGKLARGPKVGDDRKSATTAGARIKRLLVSFFALSGTPEAQRPTISVRTVPKDGGFAWAVAIKPAVPEGAIEAPSDNAEATAAATEAAK